MSHCGGCMGVTAHEAARRDSASTTPARPSLTPLRPISPIRNKLQSCMLRGSPCMAPRRAERRGLTKAGRPAARGSSLHLVKMHAAMQKSAGGVCHAQTCAHAHGAHPVRVRAGGGHRGAGEPRVSSACGRATRLWAQQACRLLPQSSHHRPAAALLPVVGAYPGRPANSLQQWGRRGCQPHPQPEPAAPPALQDC